MEKLLESAGFWSSFTQLEMDGFYSQMDVPVYRLTLAASYRRL